MALAKLISMKFVGLDGLKHFWSKAKSWIAEQITAEVTAKIAEIVAKAPDDLDTLKEIADWISAHANDAAAMNTAILANASDIATLKTSVAGTADKAVGVVDYGDTSKTIRIGYEGSGLTADKLLHLAGYTRDNSGFVKLKDVKNEELIKWLGIPRIKYADYQTPTQTFAQFDQVPIELSKFSSEVTPNNVLCFMVIYWTGVQLIASADWGSDLSTGLKCALISLKAGTGSATVRCVYMV